MPRRRRTSSPFSLFAFQDIITSVTGIMILVTMMLALELLERKENSPEVQTESLITEIRKATTETKAQIVEVQSQIDNNSGLLSFDADVLRQQIKDLERSREKLEESVRELDDKKNDANRRQGEIENAQNARSNDPQTLSQLNAEVKATQERLDKLKKSNRVIFNPSEGESKTAWLVQIQGSGILAAKAGSNARPQSFPNETAFARWAATRNKAAEYFVLLVKPSGLSKLENTRSALSQKGFTLGFDLLTEDKDAVDAETGAGW